MDIKSKHKFKKFINNLKAIRGRHTELVSVFIPAGYDLNKIISHLAQEQGTASNIKDARTRKNVIDSLERMIRHLRLFKQTPKNGLAVYSGNISKNESKIDIEVFSIEPPNPLNMRLYRCDQYFHTEELENMLETHETYGLIVMDNRDGSIGLLKGTSISIVKEMHSAVPGKIKAGGQCLAFNTSILLDDGQEIILEEVKKGDMVMSYNFKTRTLEPSEVLNTWIVKKEEELIIEFGNESILTSKDHLFFLYDGTEITAEKLKIGDKLLHKNSKAVTITKIIKEKKWTNLIDIEVKNKNFVANDLIVHNSQQRFARLREGAAKDFYNRIGDAANAEFLPLKNLKAILLGGPGTTKEKFLDGHHLNNQLKEKVIAVKDLSYTGEFGLNELVERCQDVLANEEIVKEKNIVNDFLKLLATQPKKVVYGKKDVEKALEMGAVNKLLISEFIEDYDALELKAEESGAEVFIISLDTAEGAQLKDLTGLAAILRYEYEF